MRFLSLFKKVDRFVDRNPVKPGIKTGAAFEGFQCPKRLDERFLREVIGVLVIGCHVINRRVNTFPIKPHKLVVSLQIPITLRSVPMPLVRGQQFAPNRCARRVRT